MQTCAEKARNTPMGFISIVKCLPISDEQRNFELGFEPETSGFWLAPHPEQRYLTIWGTANWSRVLVRQTRGLGFKPRLSQIFFAYLKSVYNCTQSVSHPFEVKVKITYELPWMTSTDLRLIHILLVSSTHSTSQPNPNCVIALLLCCVPATRVHVRICTCRHIYVGARQKIKRSQLANWVWSNAHVCI